MDTGNRERLAANPVSRSPCATGALALPVSPPKKDPRVRCPLRAQHCPQGQGPCCLPSQSPGTPMTPLWVSPAGA